MTSLTSKRLKRGALIVEKKTPEILSAVETCEL